LSLNWDFGVTVASDIRLQKKHKFEFDFAASRKKMREVEKILINLGLLN